MPVLGQLPLPSNKLIRSPLLAQLPVGRVAADPGPPAPRRDRLAQVVHVPVAMRAMPAAVGDPVHHVLGTCPVRAGLNRLVRTIS